MGQLPVMLPVPVVISCHLITCHEMSCNVIL